MINLFDIYIKKISNLVILITFILLFVLKYILTTKLRPEEQSVYEALLMSVLFLYTKIDYKLNSIFSLFLLACRSTGSNC